VYLDIHDSFELDATALASHDVYFKRSLRADLRLQPSRARVRAIGLVNLVHPDGLDFQEMRRVMARRDAAGRSRGAVLLRVAASTAAACWTAAAAPRCR
jgi:hypothetical protein